LGIFLARKCLIYRLVSVLINQKLSTTTPDLRKRLKAQICIGTTFGYPPRHVTSTYSTTFPIDEEASLIRCVLYVIIHEDPENSPRPVVDIKGHSWTPPSSGVPLRLSYKQAGKGLLEVGVRDAPFIDTSLVKAWIGHCGEELSDLEEQTYVPDLE
jgi:hypothetical protein